MGNKVLRRKLLGVLIKSARRKAGMSQMRLAEWLGVTYQQVQKYEAGKSNISVTRLYDIAKALDVTVVSLLPKEEEKLEVLESAEVYGLLDENEKKIVEHLRRIENKQLKRAIVKLLEELVKK